MVYKKGSDKKELILNCAEELFAKHGFDAVTVRQITQKAGVRLASVHYYFNSKENLFHEVILRRANVLNQLRSDGLDSIDLANLTQQDALIKICQAFIHPLVKLSTDGDAGWKYYCRLVAITSLNNGAKLKETFSEFDAVANQFIQAIKTAVPSISEEDNFYAFQFLLGSTISTFAESERLDHLSDGQYKASNLTRICDKLVLYTASGIQSLGEET